MKINYNHLDSSELQHAETGEFYTQIRYYIIIITVKFKWERINCIFWEPDQPVSGGTLTPSPSPTQVSNNHIFTW